MVPFRHLKTAFWTAIVTMNASFSLAYTMPELLCLNAGRVYQEVHLQRRRFLGSAALTFLSFLVDNPVTSNVALADDSVDGNGIIRSKGCYQGVGDACNEFAGDNALIQKLQQQSALNRGKNEQEALNAYYMKNYPDFFGSIGKVMIKKSSDNTFIVVSQMEAEQMKLDGKLSLEIPKARGGKIVDLTQKPILILKE